MWFLRWTFSVQAVVLRMIILQQEIKEKELEKALKEDQCKKMEEFCRNLESCIHYIEDCSKQVTGREKMAELGFSLHVHLHYVTSCVGCPASRD